MTIRDRGSAALEASVTTGLVVALLLGLLAFGYLWFARGWIEYQSEQALLCLAESKPAVHCRRRLDRALARFLPWGRTRVVLNGGKKWTIDTEWNWNGYRVHAHKQLSLSGIVKAELQ